MQRQATQGLDGKNVDHLIVELVEEYPFRSRDVVRISGHDLRIIIGYGHWGKRRSKKGATEISYPNAHLSQPLKPRIALRRIHHPASCYSGSACCGTMSSEHLEAGVSSALQLSLKGDWGAAFCLNENDQVVDCQYYEQWSVH